MIHHFITLSGVISLQLTVDVKSKNCVVLIFKRKYMFMLDSVCGGNLFTEYQSSNSPYHFRVHFLSCEEPLIPLSSPF